MIEIKEQGYELGLCVQKVKISQGILYPDVSSCLTLTAVLGDEFVGAHVALLDAAKKKGGKDTSTIIKDATIYFVKKRLEALGGKAATNNFVIGWLDSWPLDQQKKLLKGQFETAWHANLWEAAGKYGGDSADITFQANGEIKITMKDAKGAKGPISLSWQNPQEGDFLKKL